MLLRRGEGQRGRLLPLAKPEKLKTRIWRLRTNHDPKYNGSFVTWPPSDEIGQLHHCMIILFIIPAVSTCNLSITLLETDLYYLKRRQHFRQNLHFNFKFNTPLCSIVQGGGGGTNIGLGYEDVPWSWPPFSDSFSRWSPLLLSIFNFFRFWPNFNSLNANFANNSLLKTRALMQIFSLRRPYFFNLRRHIPTRKLCECHPPPPPRAHQ